MLLVMLQLMDSLQVLQAPGAVRAEGNAFMGISAQGDSPTGDSGFHHRLRKIVLFCWDYQ